MWREYTRETPARRGWAIAFSAVALVLTTSLAWVLAGHGPSGASLGNVVSPANWPINFSLPADAKPLAKWNRLPLESDETGNAGLVAFRWGSSDKSHAMRILIAYQVYNDETELKEFGSDVFGEDPSDAEPIEIGPMTGRFLTGIGPTGDRLYVAIGWIDEGLAVRINMISPARRIETGLFRRICRSIAFKNWCSPRPTVPYYFLNPRLIPPLDLGH